jgi:hypothetical protein
MKKLIIGAIILVVLFGILFTFLGVYTDRIIDPYVRSMLEETKPMNHRIAYKKIKVNLFKKIIKISDVRIYPDSSLVKDEKLWMDIRVSTMKLTDFSIWDMLFHKALHIGDLVLLKPDVKIYLPLQPAEEIIEDVKKDSVSRAKTPLLKSITLERMLLSSGSFQLIHNGEILASSPDINFVAEQISLAKNSQDDPIGYTYGQVKVYLTDITLNPESGLYDMSLGSLTVNKYDSSAVLKGFRMIPKFDKKEAPKHMNFQADLINVKVGSVEVERVGFRRLLAGQTLNISNIRIDSIDADIYRDKNIPVDLNRFPLFYNESFLKVGLPLLIDTVLITNSRIFYNELAEGRTTAGDITLSDFNLSTYGLSNQKIDSNIVNEMRLIITARIMGEGPMKAELVLPLEGNLRDFRCTGSVGAMKLPPLNGMLEPAINMNIKGGRLNRLTFDFTGNDNVSRGWMEFLYQDLDVVLLGKEPGKEKGFVSFLANTMALSNNPAPGKDLKIVEIGFERDKNKGIVGYIWRTIQSGMVRTIVPTSKYQIKNKPAENQVKKEDQKTKTKEKNKKGK